MYILSRDKDETVAEKLANINPELKNIVVSAAERFRQEGRQESEQLGWKKGRAENTLLIARAMLSKGYSIASISEITGLSEMEVEQLS